MATEGNGENFSVGERMLCRSRALLRRSCIVLFDEASAAIDHKTDQKMAEGDLLSAREVDMLTIANRLDTILGPGRVLVAWWRSGDESGRVRTSGAAPPAVVAGQGRFFALMREDGCLHRFKRQGGVMKTRALFAITRQKSNY
ncbi:hypothetical protein PRNP1_009990 [Phytophthora ramorum]